MSLVLHASVALAWCFEDEQTPAVMEVLDRVAEAGAHAPLLWPLETLNALLAAERRRRISSQTRASLVGFLTQLPITLDSHTAEQAWTITARLAEAHRLTIYDAVYLELAQRRRLPLATLDRDLRRATEALAIKPVLYSCERILHILR